MERRTLLLITSLLVAALGTALIWLYVQGADQRARAGQELVQVYVARQDIQPNRPASTLSALVQRKSFSKESVGDLDYVRDLGELDEQKTNRLVSRGLPLLRSQFDADGGTPEPIVELAEGKIGMQVALADPQRVAGVLKPGSLIAVFAAVNDRGDEKADYATAVLSKVKVLAADGVADETPATTGTNRRNAVTVPKTSVTLEVDGTQMAKLVLAQAQGSSVSTLWFGLLGSERTPVESGRDGEVRIPELLAGDGGNP